MWCVIGNSRTGRVYHFTRQVVNQDLTIVCQNLSPLQNVYQLSNVAGPAVRQQQLASLFVNFPVVT